MRWLKFHWKKFWTVRRAWKEHLTVVTAYAIKKREFSRYKHNGSSGRGGLKRRRTRIRKTGQQLVATGSQWHLRASMTFPPKIT